MRRRLLYETAALTALCGLFFSGCKEEKADPKAEAPAPVKVEREQDVNVVQVDHPEQFPVAAAVGHVSTSQLVVNGVVSPDISRTVPVISLAVGRVVEIKAFR
jgi:cobalt-zinc-cadmium efflux system membrane fusion protein